MTIGQLARRTRISSRTLRYYEQIGLLLPTGRSPAGYRTYGPAQIARLQQIVSLQSSGLSLARIRELLDRGATRADAVIQGHMMELERQIHALQSLHGRLSRLVTLLHSKGSPNVDDLLQIIEEITMLEKHLEPAHFAALNEHHQKLDPARVKRGHRELQQVVQQFDELHRSGAPTAGSLAQAAAGRLSALMEEFTGGDTALMHALLGAGQAFFAHAGGPAVGEDLAGYICRALAENAG